MDEQNNMRDAGGTSHRAHLCFMCQRPVSGNVQPTMDMLSTVVSKVTVREKVEHEIGCHLSSVQELPTGVCPDCYHVVNEIDVLEHRLSMYRNILRNNMHASITNLRDKKKPLTSTFFNDEFVQSSHSMTENSIITSASNLEETKLSIQGSVESVNVRRRSPTNNTSLKKKLLLQKESQRFEDSEISLDNSPATEINEESDTSQIVCRSSSKLSSRDAVVFSPLKMSPIPLTYKADASLLSTRSPECCVPHSSPRLVLISPTTGHGISLCTSASATSNSEEIQSNSSCNPSTSFNNVVSLSVSCTQPFSAIHSSPRLCPLSPVMSYTSLYAPLTAVSHLPNNQMALDQHSPCNLSICSSSNLSLSPKLDLCNKSPLLPYSNISPPLNSHSLKDKTIRHTEESIGDSSRKLSDKSSPGSARVTQSCLISPLPQSPLSQGKTVLSKDSEKKAQNVSHYFNITSGEDSFDSSIANSFLSANVCPISLPFISPSLTCVPTYTHSATPLLSPSDDLPVHSLSSSFISHALSSSKCNSLSVVSVSDSIAADDLLSKVENNQSVSEDLAGRKVPQCTQNITSPTSQNDPEKFSSFLDNNSSVVAVSDRASSPLLQNKNKNLNSNNTSTVHISSTTSSVNQNTNAQCTTILTLSSNHSALNSAIVKNNSTEPSNLSSLQNITLQEEHVTLAHSNYPEEPNNDIPTMSVSSKFSLFNNYSKSCNLPNFAFTSDRVPIKANIDVDTKILSNSAVIAASVANSKSVMPLPSTVNSNSPVVSVHLTPPRLVSSDSNEYNSQLCNDILLTCTSNSHVDVSSNVALNLSNPECSDSNISYFNVDKTKSKHTYSSHFSSPTTNLNPQDNYNSNVQSVNKIFHCANNFSETVLKDNSIASPFEKYSESIISNLTCLMEKNNKNKTNNLHTLIKVKKPILDDSVHSSGRTSSHFELSTSQSCRNHTEGVKFNSVKGQSLTVNYGCDNDIEHKTNKNCHISGATNIEDVVELSDLNQQGPHLEKLHLNDQNTHDSLCNSSKINLEKDQLCEPDNAFDIELSSNVQESGQQSTIDINHVGILEIDEISSNICNNKGIIIDSVAEKHANEKISFCSKGNDSSVVPASEVSEKFVSNSYSITEKNVEGFFQKTTRTSSNLPCHLHSNSVRRKMHNKVIISSSICNDKVTKKKSNIKYQNKKTISKVNISNILERRVTRSVSKKLQMNANNNESSNCEHSVLVKSSSSPSKLVTSDSTSTVKYLISERNPSSEELPSKMSKNTKFSSCGLEKLIAEDQFMSKTAIIIPTNKRINHSDNSRKFEFISSDCCSHEGDCTHSLTNLQEVKCLTSDHQHSAYPLTDLPFVDTFMKCDDSNNYNDIDGIEEKLQPISSSEKQNVSELLQIGCQYPSDSSQIQRNGTKFMNKPVQIQNIQQSLDFTHSSVSSKVLKLVDSIQVPRQSAVSELVNKSKCAEDTSKEDKYSLLLSKHNMSDSGITLPLENQTTNSNCLSYQPVHNYNDSQNQLANVDSNNVHSKVTQSNYKTNSSLKILPKTNQLSSVESTNQILPQISNSHNSVTFDECANSLSHFQTKFIQTDAHNKTHDFCDASISNQFNKQVINASLSNPVFCHQLNHLNNLVEGQNEINISSQSRFNSNYSSNHNGVPNGAPVSNMGRVVGNVSHIPTINQLSNQTHSSHQLESQTQICSQDNNMSQSSKHSSETPLSNRVINHTQVHGEDPHFTVAHNQGSSLIQDHQLSTHASGHIMSKFNNHDCRINTNPVDSSSSQSILMNQIRDTTHTSAVSNQYYEYAQLSHNSNQNNLVQQSQIPNYHSQLIQPATSVCHITATSNQSQLLCQPRHMQQSENACNMDKQLQSHSVTLKTTTLKPVKDRQKFFKQFSDEITSRTLNHLLPVKPGQNDKDECQETLNRVTNNTAQTEKNHTSTKSVGSLKLTNEQTQTPLTSVEIRNNITLSENLKPYGHPSAVQATKNNIAKSTLRTTNNFSYSHSQTQTCQSDSKNVMPCQVNAPNETTQNLSKTGVNVETHQVKNHVQTNAQTANTMHIFTHDITQNANHMRHNGHAVSQGQYHAAAAQNYSNVHGHMHEMPVHNPACNPSIQNAIVNQTYAHSLGNNQSLNRIGTLNVGNNCPNSYISLQNIESNQLLAHNSNHALPNSNNLHGQPSQTLSHMHCANYAQMHNDQRNRIGANHLAGSNNLHMQNNLEHHINNVNAPVPHNIPDNVYSHSLINIENSDIVPTMHNVQPMGYSHCSSHVGGVVHINNPNHRPAPIHAMNHSRSILPRHSTSAKDHEAGYSHTLEHHSIVGIQQHSHQVSSFNVNHDNSQSVNLPRLRHDEAHAHVNSGAIGHIGGNSSQLQTPIQYDVLNEHGPSNNLTQQMNSHCHPNQCLPHMVYHGNAIQNSHLNEEQVQYHPQSHTYVPHAYSDLHCMQNSSIHQYPDYQRTKHHSHTQTLHEYIPQNCDMQGHQVGFSNAPANNYTGSLMPVQVGTHKANNFNSCGQQAHAKHEIIPFASTSISIENSRKQSFASDTYQNHQESVKGLEPGAIPLVSKSCTSSEPTSDASCKRVTDRTSSKCTDKNLANGCSAIEDYVSQKSLSKSQFNMANCNIQGKDYEIHKNLRLQVVDPKDIEPSNSIHALFHDGKRINSPTCIDNSNIATTETCPNKLLTHDVGNISMADAGCMFSLTHDCASTNDCLLGYQAIEHEFSVKIQQHKSNTSSAMNTSETAIGGASAILKNKPEQLQSNSLPREAFQNENSESLQMCSLTKADFKILKDYSNDQVVGTNKAVLHLPSADVLDAASARSSPDLKMSAKNPVRRSLNSIATPEDDGVLDNQPRESAVSYASLSTSPVAVSAGPDSNISAFNKASVDVDIDIEECDCSDDHILDLNSEHIVQTDTEGSVILSPKFDGKPRCFYDESKQTDVLESTESVSQCSATFDASKEVSHPSDSSALQSIATSPLHDNQVPSNNSSPHHQTGFSRPSSPELLRNVQEATEYHKPTLLMRNFKTKKHAKLQICRQCDQVFSTRQCLIRHIERRHRPNAVQLICPTCHKKCNSDKSLARHLQQHKSFPCKLCGRTFLRRIAFKKHIEEHTQQSLVCTHCNKECSSIQALIMHTNTHLREKPQFICAVCQKKFANKRNLNIHARIHSGDRPHSCSNCNKAFSVKCNMLAHREICLGKCKFKCVKCNRAFPLQSLYNRHMAEHEGKYSHSCCVCKKGFSKLSGLKAHMKIHTLKVESAGETNDSTVPKKAATKSRATRAANTAVSCPVCNKKLARPEQLTDHVARHSDQRNHKCPQCPRSFFYKNNILPHQRAAHLGERPHACATCDKKFALKSALNVHLLVHTGEKPHQCDSCGKAFATKSNFKRHLKCHGTAIAESNATS